VAQQGGVVTETGEKVKGVGCLPSSVDVRFRQRLKWNREVSGSIEVSSKEGFESRWQLFWLPRMASVIALAILFYSLYNTGDEPCQRKQL
jgi:hypothetical protein